MKWVSSSIAKTFELGEIDLKTVEHLISEVCTHLMAAGVMKQIIDGDETTKDVFCVSKWFFVLVSLFQWQSMYLKHLKTHPGDN